jgi:hypothetical protein
MVDGKQPMVCQDRKGYEIRPSPYSFYGKCPIEGYYVRPEGKKRPDGKFEPCCFKMKASGKDSMKQYLETLRNGFKDTPDPDNLSAVFIPGTKTLESRRFKGLIELPEESLLNCMKESGYMGDASIFKYNSFKSDVLDSYQRLVNTEALVFQLPSALTNDKLPLKKDYLVTEIHKDCIRVFLFFDATGNSFFINSIKDVSESGIPQIEKLANTLIDGYLYPFKGDDFVFYPIDILYYIGNRLSTDFYPGNNSRFNVLMYSIDIINTFEPSLEIVVNFENNLLEVSGDSLLFIPYKGSYTFKKINKELLIWTNVKVDNIISLDISKNENGKFTVSIDGKLIPEILLPQVKNTIELPTAFTKKINSGIVLFKINLNANGIINNNKPLVPIEKSSFHINDYQDIINILESINNPVKNIV